MLAARRVYENEEMARLFSEATPYIQKYHGKTMVVKYGGNAMINEELKNAVMNDLVTLTLLGVRVVLVHGGGPAINEMLKKVGVESHFANGLRVTDDATMEIVQQVLAGKVNKDLVAKLRAAAWACAAWTARCCAAPSWTPSWAMWARSCMWTPP